MIRDFDDVISGDTHLEIDSRNWIDRVPPQHRERAPRVVRLPDGSDAWLVEGAPLRTTPQDLYGGKGRDKWLPYGQNYETTAGTGSAKQRLGEQDEDGIKGEVLFPGASGPNMWRNIRSDEAYRSVVRAYNGYLAEEYCPEDPSRLLGIGVIPQTGVDDAIDEMQWCKEHDLVGVLLHQFPNGAGKPSLEDDRFWAAALEMQMPVTVHGQIRPTTGSLIDYPAASAAIQREIKSGSHVQFAEQMTKMARDAGINAIQLILSGVFDRFPDLEIFFAETQIGWIPLFIEVAEQRFRRHTGWAENILGWTPLKHGTPRDYIQRHCLWGFQEDPIGVKLREDIGGPSQLIWATDFPHQESEWPYSDGVFERNFKDVAKKEVETMVAGNVRRFFHLTDD